MKCVWMILIYFIVMPAYAETPLSVAPFRNQYEINSETVFFSDNNLVQSDLRLLVGRKFNFWKDRDLRLSVGGYGLYQDADKFEYSYRQGALAQVKINLWYNWLFFVYEFHRFTLSHQSNFQDENRFGLYGGYYYQIDERGVLDIYGESFYIPKVSDRHLLSTGRASIYWDTQFFAFHILDFLTEIYAKDSPVDWGGSRNDWRVGLKLQPWDFLAVKFFVPIASSETNAAGDWQGQINIFKVGDF